MWRVMSIFLIAGTVSLAEADQSSSATGKYGMDLGQLKGAVESVQNQKEICIESFPEYESKIEDSYENWRSRNLDFILEVQSSVVNYIYQAANGDPIQINELRFMFAENKRKNKLALAYSLKKLGLENYINNVDICQGF